MKYLKKLSLIVLIYGMSLATLRAQAYLEPLIKIGASRMENQLWGELMLGLGTYAIYDALEASTFGFAGGFEWRPGEFSPKLSLGAAMGGALAPTASMNVNYYHKRQNLVFTPEIGLNLIKVLHITYGYQFNRAAENPDVPRDNSKNHRVSIFLTIPLPLLR